MRAPVPRSGDLVDSHRFNAAEWWLGPLLGVTRVRLQRCFSKRVEELPFGLTVPLWSSLFRGRLGVDFVDASALIPLLSIMPIYDGLIGCR